MTTFRCRLAKIAALATAVLVGHVTDATTGQPLPNVTIAVGRHHTNTDAHGAYKITGLSPGSYTLSASSNDVPPQRRSVVVKRDAQTVVNLVLCSTTLDYGCGNTGPG